MNPFDDLRVVKSKQKIQTAIEDLLDSQEFDKITISEICLAANITRATFYHHYSSKDEVVDEYQKDIMKRIFVIITREQFDSKRFFYQVILHLENEGQLLGKLLSNNGSLKIQNQVKQGMKTFFKKYLLPQLNLKAEREELKEYQSIFGTNAIFGVIQHWLTTERRASPEELQQILLQIVPDVLLPKS